MVKNPHIIHFARWRSYKVLYSSKGVLYDKPKYHKYLGYVCIGCVGFTKSKSTRDWKKVTCENCLRRRPIWKQQ